MPPFFKTFLAFDFVVFPTVSKIKTDKADAKQIYEYGKNQNSKQRKESKLKTMERESEKQQQCLQILRLLSIYTKQNTQLKNKIHGENVLGTPSKEVVNSLNRQLKSVKKEIQKMEILLENIVKEEHLCQDSLKTRSIHLIDFEKTISYFH